MMDQLVRAALVMGSLALTACSSSSDSAASALDGSVSETGGASAGGFAGNGGGRGGVGASPSGTGGSSGLGGSAGGSSGLGGSAGGSAGSGGSNTGGVAFGSGGLCGCQCAPNAIRLQVSARGSDGGTGVLGSLTVKGSGVDMQCLRSGCTFVCTSTQSTLADGDYSVSIGAPGYRSQTVQIHVTTSCGCCGCCAISTPSSVELLPDGSPITGCCSDLTNDPSNCGACGKTCPAEAWCARSACTPLFSPCTGANSGFSSCTAYCKSIGKSCSAACGPSGTESIEWWGQSSINCGDNVYSSNGTCDDNLLGYGARCCCTG